MAQALAYGLLHRHELWRLRCEEVLRKERPAEERQAWEAVCKLRERAMEVGAADRSLFERRNAPAEGGDLVKMSEWVRSVKNSIGRKEKLELKGQRRLDTYFGGNETR